MENTDKLLPSGAPGVFIADLPWDATVAWAVAQQRSGVPTLWYRGSRDPVLFLASLSQKIDTVNLGLFISQVLNRPPLLAAKQLMTLYNLSDGRLQIAVDDDGVRFLSVEYELEKLGEMEGNGIPRLWR